MANWQGNEKCGKFKIAEIQKKCGTFKLLETKSTKKSAVNYKLTENDKGAVIESLPFLTFFVL